MPAMEESAPAERSQTTSQVHACLSMAEILSRIMEECIGGQRSSKFSTLASLARTCKALRDPALDRMWRDQFGLQNLIKCLPSHVWNEEHWTFSEEVDIEDWERFDFYASRIVNLILTQWKLGDRPDQSVFVSFLSRRRGLLTLLPNLVSLKWHSTESDPLSHTTSRAETFFNDKLKTLRISCYSDTPSLVSSLTYLPRYSPHLQDLWLSAYADLSPMSAKLAKVIGYLVKLRSLCIFSFTSEEPQILSEVVYDKISCLPFLVRFETNCISHDASRPPKVIVSTRFPALRELKIEPSDAQSCLFWIQAFVTRNLRELEIRLPHFPSSTDIRDIEQNEQETSLLRLFEEIERIVDHSELKVLTIEDIYRGSAGLTLASLRPVFSFKMLEDVCISFSDGVVLDDTALEEMAKRWGAGLRRLRISGIFTMDGETVTVRPTLEALIHLVRHCPRLEELEIELDATGIAPFNPHARPGRGCSNKLLTGLHVGWSPIENPINVAAFLFDLFPNLEDVYAPGENDGWSEIESCLAAFRMVRSWSQLAASAVDMLS